MDTVTQIQILQKSACIFYGSNVLRKGIHLFYLLLWINSCATWALLPWYGNWSGERKQVNIHLNDFQSRLVWFVYVKYVRFSLIGFYGISTHGDNIISNPPYIMNIYLVGLGFIWYINPCRLFNHKSSLYIIGILPVKNKTKSISAV